jgi:hypothetical protein
MVKGFIKKVSSERRRWNAISEMLKTSKKDAT